VWYAGLFLVGTILEFHSDLPATHTS